MKAIVRRLLSISAVNITAATLSLIVVLGTPSGARADEADAKKLLKAMSDYLAEQTAVSFDFDAILEVIT